MHAEIRVTGTRGFTLIELLTVLAIVMILLSLLMPALLSARRSAIASKCLSNVKQLMAATIMYANDYQKYPDIVPGDPDQPFSGSGGNGRLVSLLRPYATSPELFLCPANVTEIFGPNAEGLGTSYKYNEAIKFANVNAENIYASWAVVYIDNKDWEPRHNKGANLAFLDGHVKWYPKAGPKGYGDGVDPYGNSSWYNWGKP